ncbi:MAG: hypothetical protein RMM29_03180 [Planctomycetota bacterium]|nr:hypothetical protein [Planctomycetota bacterium]MCX8039256.1 hypothetical protein [Planctomycetota bacterium]MDW8372635.1 hypothetical protein [Planctomycetota bacterium]
MARRPELLGLGRALLAAAAAASAAAETTTAAVQPYPLAVCLVSREPLGSAPRVVVHEGQEIKLCCGACLRRFERDPAFYLKRLRAAVGEGAQDGGR